MTSRLLRTIAFIVLGAAIFFTPSGDRCVHAQGKGRNIFEVQRNAPTRTRPKADDETRDRLNRALQDEFTNGLGTAGSYLYYLAFLLFLGILIGVLIHYDLRRRSREKTGYDNSKLLFRELCAAHQLTAVERRFLRDFAEDNDLEDPLPLFIEPHYFYDALDGRRYDDFSRMLRYLLVKLFDIKVAQETKATDSGLKGPKSADKHTETTIYVPPRRV